MQNVTVGPNTELLVRADGEFYVWREEGEKLVLLGPDSVTDRKFKLAPSREGRKVAISCQKSVQVFVTFTAKAPHAEELDPTPVEVPLGYQQPLTLQEEMRRFIREEISRAAQEGGAGTFEEEDDFDVDDDDDLPLSEYELTELQSEVPLEKKVKTPPPAKPPDDAAPQAQPPPVVSSDDKAVPPSAGGPD